MAKMRVLEVGKFYHPYKGGMETCLYDLCMELKKSVDLRVLVSNDRRGTVVEEVEGVPVIRVSSMGTLFSTSVCPSFPLWLRKMRADIVSLHLPNPLSAVSYFLARPSGKLVVVYQSDIVRQRLTARLYAPFLSAVLRKASRIIVSSPDYLESSPVLKDFEEKCRVIPIGIDLERFRKSPDVETKAREIREEYGSRIVLFVGRLSKYKGVDVLLKAMKQIDGRLLVAGRGEEEDRLRSLAGSLGLGERVAFLGEIHSRDFPDYLHACDVLVLPSVSRNEAFGVIQLEAFACSKPVVSTALETGVRYVNRDGETGLLVPPGDAAALADAVNSLLADEALRQRMGAVGRARVEEKFTREKMAYATLALFHEVEKGKGAWKYPNERA